MMQVRAQKATKSFNGLEESAFADCLAQQMRSRPHCARVLGYLQSQTSVVTSTPVYGHGTTALSRTDAGLDEAIKDQRRDSGPQGGGAKQD